jgi:hypothetical protein|nr:MAG TPA: hypothetical protein [Caudoviricetes sp.]
MNIYNKYIAEPIYKWINSGGWLHILALGLLGIVCTILAIYGRFGFNIWRFIFADIPLFGFCAWALYQCVYKTIKNNKEIFKINKDE